MMDFPKGFKQREQAAASRRAQLQRDLSIRAQRGALLAAKRAELFGEASEEAEAAEAVEAQITSAASMVTVNPDADTAPAEAKPAKKSKKAEPAAPADAPKTDAEGALIDDEE